MQLNFLYKLQKSFEQTSVPAIFQSAITEPGKYFWGIGSVEKLDLQGEVVDKGGLMKRAGEFTKAPYNKVFVAHKHDDIAAGTIVVSKYIDNLKEMLKGSVDNVDELPEEGHLIVGKLNESHPFAINIWGSILNKSLDAWSLYGEKVKRENIYNPKNGMMETHITDFMPLEASICSLPVNPGSVMLGTFSKSLNHGLILTETKEEQMENYITKEEFEKSFKELSDKVSKAIEGMENFQKAIKDDLAKTEEILKKAKEDEEKAKQDALAKAEAEKTKEAPKDENLAKAVRNSQVKDNKITNPDAMKKSLSDDMPFLGMALGGK